jgi:hypothetical protein
VNHLWYSHVQYRYPDSTQNDPYPAAAVWFCTNGTAAAESKEMLAKGCMRGKMGRSVLDAHSVG